MMRQLLAGTSVREGAKIHILSSASLSDNFQAYFNLFEDSIA